MSIAISAVVNPSRLLLAAIGGMCGGIAFAAGMVGLSKVGELSFYPRCVMAGLCALTAFLGFFQAFWKRKTFRIDISGIGQIRLMEYNGVADSSRQREWPNGEDNGELVQLAAGSTIWPYLLLLRLEAEGRRTVVLPILPDCVGADNFRALSVACRWIAAHNIRAEGKIV